MHFQSMIYYRSVFLADASEGINISTKSHLFFSTEYMLCDKSRVS